MPVLAITARVLARFGPWLGRLMKASPAVFEKVVQTIGTKTGFFAKSAAELVAYAKANPLNATLVFTTIASLGVSIADMFDAADVAEDGGRTTATVLNLMTLGKSHDEALSLIAATASASESLKSDLIGLETRMDLLQTVCTWAKGHYGSVRGAINAHQMHQAFVELPLAEVELGFRRLRT